MKLFRDLPPDDVIYFQKWARDNYIPFTSINGLWHPVVQMECAIMNKEEANRFKEEEE